MGCANCSTNSKGQVRGCKNNGVCGLDSCNKLTVFDWLANIKMPSGAEPFKVVEVRFKNSRKAFFKNTNNLPLAAGDTVATEASPGHDVGIVTLTGELVRVQMKNRKIPPDADLPKIYRKASNKDITVWTTARNKEEGIKKTSRELAISLKLKMKLSDVEFQGDGSKATFYYTAEERVDFRQLIKDMARTFGIRIEMRQIGYRQEAARLGGVGSCGRELCCATWLTDFRSVSTAAARYQQLSLNPQKLAGQCGKLKCCLNYELEVYQDALKEFPSLETTLYTQKGVAHCQKTDIFKKLFWFAYANEAAHWHKLSLEQVNKIIQLNKKDVKPASLEEYENELQGKAALGFENVVGQDSLSRFDHNKGRRRRQKTSSKRRRPRARKK